MTTATATDAVTFDETWPGPAPASPVLPLFLRAEFPEARPDAYRTALARVHVLQRAGLVAVQCAAEGYRLIELWARDPFVVEELKAFARGADSCARGEWPLACPHLGGGESAIAHQLGGPRPRLLEAWQGGHAAAWADLAAKRPSPTSFTAVVTAGGAELFFEFGADEVGVISDSCRELPTEDLLARWCSDVLTHDLAWQHDNADEEPDESEYASCRPMAVTVAVGNTRKTVEVTALEMHLIALEKGLPEDDELLTAWAEGVFRLELRTAREELGDKILDDPPPATAATAELETTRQAILADPSLLDERAFGQNIIGITLSRVLGRAVTPDDKRYLPHLALVHLGLTEERFDRLHRLSHWPEDLRLRWHEIPARREYLTHPAGHLADEEAERRERAAITAAVIERFVTACREKVCGT